MKRKPGRIWPFKKIALRAAPVSERACRTPKIYRKDAWLSEFWQGIMDDFRALFARPFEAEERDGEIVLYVLGLWKYVFRNDGILTIWRKEFSASGRIQSREQQFSFSRDDAVFRADWKWTPSCSCPPFFGTCGKSQAGDCASFLLGEIIYEMEHEPVFVLEKYYDSDECEFVLHHRSFSMCDTHEENRRETGVERILRGSRIKKYLARSIRSFFPRFFRRFADYFDAPFLEKIGDAGWSGDYEKYRLYAAHKNGVSRVLRERPNLLPLLDTVNAGWWERPDLFAADNWTKERSPDMEPETLPPWCSYFGAIWAWHPVSRPVWKMLASLPASDIEMLLRAGFGCLYDLDALHGLLKIGRKFPRELLPCAVFFTDNFRISSFFVYKTNRGVWRELARWLGGEGRLPVIGRALTRTGRLWLSELAKSSDIRFTIRTRADTHGVRKGAAVFR